MPAIPSTVVSVLRSPEVANTLFWNWVSARGKNAGGRTPDRIRADINVHDTRVRQLYAELAQQEAHNSEDYRDNAITSFGLAREDLMKNPNIVDMFIADSQLFIQFKDIECYISELDSTYDLGSFMLCFNLNTSSFSIYSLKYFVVRTSGKKDMEKQAI